MSKKDFDEIRMLRLNGQRPTARERWKAFHRLYRITRGLGVDETAGDCFHVLLPSGRWVALVHAEECLSSRVGWPPFLRRRVLAADRRRRLFGPGYRWLDGCTATAAKLRSQGIEATPEQVAEVRLKILRIAREKAYAAGFVPPADDDELFRLLCGREGEP